MLTPEKLHAVRTIVTHEYCPDGTASAIILRDAFPGKNVKIQFVQYGSEEQKNLVVEPGMLFCDIGPVAERAPEFVAAGALILDHHKTNRAVVESFGENGVFADEALEPGVCGAVLAYRHVWRTLEPSFSVFDPQTEKDVSRVKFIHDFATLAGVRDTWQRKDPRWPLACAQASVLNFIPNDQWLSQGLSVIAATWETNYAPLGQLLQDKQAKDVARMAKKGWPFTTAKGTRVLVIPSKGLTSDVAELLDTEYDLIAGFGYTFEPAVGVPEMILSLRSRTSFDCSAFCKAHGGGGHTKAAGCSFEVMPDTLNPYIFTEKKIRAYEGL